FPKLTNAVFSNRFSSNIMKEFSGIAKERSLPLLSIKSLSKYHQSISNQINKTKYIKTVYLFNDEFTNHLDAEIGIDAIELLGALNYNVVIVKHPESGRAFLSKGLLRSEERR